MINIQEVCPLADQNETLNFKWWLANWPELCNFVFMSFSTAAGRTTQVEPEWWGGLLINAATFMKYTLINYGWHGPIFNQ